MADTKQNQDDLIILSDDVQTDDSEMVINLDEEEKSWDDMVLTFDEEETNSQESKEEEILTESTWYNQEDKTDDIFSFDTPKEESKQEVEILEETPKVESQNTQEDWNDDFNFDLGESESSHDDNEKEEENIVLEESDDSNISVWNDLDLTGGDETTQEDFDLSSDVEAQPHENPNLDTSNPTPMASVGTMESILDETILKLENRQDVIATQEEKETEHIETLEERIAALEKEKQNALDKKAELEKENKNIKENITALEKMKKTDDVKKSTKK